MEIGRDQFLSALIGLGIATVPLGVAAAFLAWPHHPAPAHGKQARGAHPAARPQHGARPAAPRPTPMAMPRASVAPAPVATAAGEAGHAGAAARGPDHAPEFAKALGPVLAQVEHGRRLSGALAQVLAKHRDDRQVVVDSCLMQLEAADALIAAVAKLPELDTPQRALKQQFTAYARANRASLTANHPPTSSPDGMLVTAIRAAFQYAGSSPAMANDPRFQAARQEVEQLAGQAGEPPLVARALQDVRAAAAKGDAAAKQGLKKLEQAGVR